MRAVAFVGFMMVFVVLLSSCGAQGAPATATEEATPAIEHETPTSEVAQSPSYRDITPVEAKALIDENPDLVVIDVGAHPTGILPGAIVLPVEGALEESLGTFDPEGHYLVYGRYDTASTQGAQMLVDSGFKNVYRLLGEFQAWKAAGYEVEIWVPTFE
jgi:adenylyltransferase/sulfurtransferase